MEIKYKPSKPQKVKPAKSAKPAKPAKPAKAAPMGIGAATAVKIEKPKAVKAPKAPKAPKLERAKAISFGKVKAEKVAKSAKSTKVGKPSKLPKFFEKVDPKLVLGGAIALVAVIAVVVLTVVLPAIEEHGQQIKNIVVSVSPNKTTYYTGEEADYEGLRVLVTKNNGDTQTVRAGRCQITGFDSSKASEKQAITVTYEGHSAVFYVEIKETPKPVSILNSIKLETLPKTQYKLGERLSTTNGVILCEYKDGTTKRVNLVNSDVYGYAGITAPGTYTLTVKYSENGRTAETTYTITVTK